MLTNSEWKFQTFYSFADLSEDAFADILDKAIWHPDTPVVENTFVDKKFLTNLLIRASAS